MTKAFTLIEIIIVIALMSILIGISTPVYLTLQYASEVGNGLQVSVSTLRLAQLQAISGYNDSEWGVQINSDKLILFKGSTYATRDTGYDVTYTLPTGLSISGPSEIIFSKLYGLPNTTGTIIISKYNNSNQIVINAKGIQSY